MKRIRDKIVGELIPRPHAGSFNKGLITGVILGATVTLASAYVNQLMQENALLRASVQGATAVTQVPVSATSPETTPSPARVKANQYENLTLPPPFEDQTTGKDISI